MLGRRHELTRSLQVPDRARAARYARAPELGPRVLFFTGGNALREACRVLVKHTHNSVHLVTPFDSGGSSARLRQAFGMLGVGDLRNRIVALADESVHGNPATQALFSHRFSEDADPAALDAELRTMAAGTHPLLTAVADSLRRLLRSTLSQFVARAPGFDLRGASIGNLLLASGWLEHGDMAAVSFLFSHIVEARGVVLPTVDASLHLAARLGDGRVVVGQHRLTCRAGTPLGSPIERLWLSASLEDPTEVDVAIDEEVGRLIATSELVVYPFGSFYTSVLANLLPRGVGRALVATRVPKVFVPGLGQDPEQVDMTLSQCVETLVEAARRDAPDARVTDVVTHVLVDPDGEHAARPDLDRVRALGVDVVLTELCRAPNRVDPEHLVTALMSFV